MSNWLGPTGRSSAPRRVSYLPGFTPSHVDVLIALADARQPISAKVLGARAGVLPNALTALVAVLQQRALLDRQRSIDDRRLVMIHITPEGRRTARRLQRMRQGFEQRVRRELSATAAAGLEASLLKLERGAAAFEADGGASQ